MRKINGQMVDREKWSHRNCNTHRGIFTNMSSVPFISVGGRMCLYLSPVYLFRKVY